jgi:ribonuclease G
MAKEICISSTPHETRLAILEDDQLSEIYYERENEYTLAGSIYNGRVTRVLPGMQSAFVDLGLERDAFLYVTDFLEMEDPEDSDEVEKAAVSGPSKPREVRSAHRRATEAAPVAEIAIEPVETTAAAPAAFAGEEAAQSDEDSEGGARRWRGRRRRRGGRGQAAPIADPVETESTSETYLEATPEVDEEDSHEIHASAFEAPAEQPREARSSGRRESRSDRPGREARPEARPDREARPAREARPERESTPFVLPGESLSKYGAETAPASRAEKPAAADTTPARPLSTSKPSTLIQSTIEWDGTGLLPGESISRHKNREGSRATEPESTPAATVEAEPQGVFADAHSASAESEQAGDFAFLDQKLEEATPETAAEPYMHLHDDAQIEALHSAALESLGVQHEEHILDTFTEEAHAPIVDEEEVAHTHVAEPVAEPASEHEAESAETHTGPVFEFEEQEENAPEEADRSASHHVDPLPPSEFRLFGLGGKKKSGKPDQESEPEFLEKTPVATVASAYAPGNGLVEEELIEEEELDSPHRHLHSHAENDLDEYEETEQLRTAAGEFSTAFKQAKLGITVEADEDVDEDEIEAEEEGAEETTAAPATRERSGSGRDRGGRGRRGRTDRGGGDRGSERSGDRGGQNRRGSMSRRTAQTSDLPIISDLLKPGQEILVQIAKEPIAKKGARITSHIALPGRFLVFMPTVSHVGVSRKIDSDEERQRLKRILVHERGEATGGFIVRTAAEGASEDELRSDLRFLIHLWDEIKQRSENTKSPALIYHDLSLIERILRDQVSDNFSSIWVDNEAAYERIVRFLNRFSPTLVRRVKLYTKETPLFEHFGIEDEISKALRSKVWLKSGGSIVINQTEALVAIDINTGKYVGKTARLEDTIVKTNLDAIPEIVRQIRLRDLGGIIIIDFIDMDERKNRFRVMAALEEALKNDRAPTKVLQFNDFGLVAITRKRVKQSLERTLSIPCATCQATGMVKSPATVCNEIYIELRKMRKHFENADIMLRVHPETVKVLKSNNARWLTEYEELIGKNILVKSDAALHPEQFDIQG